MTVRKSLSLNCLNLDSAAERPERTEEYHEMPERVRIAVFGLTIRSTPMVLAQPLAIEVLAGSSVRAWKPGIDLCQVRNWVKKYQTKGEAGLEQKEPGNPLVY